MQVFSLFSSGSNVPEINSLANDDNNKTTSTEEKEILSPDEYLSATTVTQYDTSLITDEDSQVKLCKSMDPLNYKVIITHRK